MKMPIQFGNGYLQRLFIHVRSSLWFLPAMIILVAVLLAFGLIQIDQSFGVQLRESWHWLYQSEADGARGMLSAIASSIATITGVAFSITVVALALASTQYTSRVLRNFMRDRAIQGVLGVFVGSYIYCLLVLRVISGGENAFVPSLAVLGGVVLAITAIGFFVFFIHHISASIQASEIAAAITRETINAIDRLFPDEEEPVESHEAISQASNALEWQPVPALSIGYIQSTNLDELFGFAVRHQTVLRMDRCIGEFVAPGIPLVSLANGRAPDNEMIADINRIYGIASYRTISQDPAFGFRQLVDISLKALSPGINDTTTAVTCIEHLGALLLHCSRKCMRPAHRYEKGQLRVLALGPDFTDLLGLAFDQILESAAGNTEIMLRMLAAVHLIAGSLESDPRMGALTTHLIAIEEAAMKTIASSAARGALNRQFDVTRLALAQAEQRIRKRESR